MGRDHRKLRVLRSADELVGDVYRATGRFPLEERFGLQSQLRRASISVSTNIFEGCARPSQRDYARFLAVAKGSAAEVRYLIEVADRLGFLEHGERDHIEPRYRRLVGALHRLIASLSLPKP